MESFPACEGSRKSPSSGNKELQILSVGIPPFKVAELALLLSVWVEAPRSDVLEVEIVYFSEAAALPLSLLQTLHSRNKVGGTGEYLILLTFAFCRAEQLHEWYTDLPSTYIYASLPCERFSGPGSDIIFLEATSSFVVFSPERLDSKSEFDVSVSVLLIRITLPSVEVVRCGGPFGLWESDLGICTSWFFPLDKVPASTRPVAGVSMLAIPFSSLPLPLA